MSKVIIPHKVGSAAIASPELKTVVMQFMENFLALGGQIADLRSAVREVENRPVVSPEIEDIETYVARAESASGTAVAAKNAAVQASAAAVPAGQTATAKAGEASVSAANAASSESTASEAALTASSAAERAEAAAALATYVNGFAICNIDLGADTYTKFTMASLVPDAAKSYAVVVTFNNTSTTAYTCTVTDGTTTKSASVTSRAGATPTATTEPLVVSGDGYFKIDNQTASVDVVVKIYFAVQGEEQQEG